MLGVGGGVLRTEFFPKLEVDVLRYSRQGTIFGTKILFFACRFLQSSQKPLVCPLRAPPQPWNQSLPGLPSVP